MPIVFFVIWAIIMAGLMAIPAGMTSVNDSVEKFALEDQAVESEIDHVAPTFEAQDGAGPSATGTVSIGIS